MTSDLKDLMDRATERLDPFMPDTERLVAAGRRRARIRRTMVGAATASVVATGRPTGTGPGAARPPDRGPAGDAHRPVREVRQRFRYGELQALAGDGGGALDRQGGRALGR
jgi:hypothetical protein